jgi:hypothetical protein
VQEQQDTGGLHVADGDLDANNMQASVACCSGAADQQLIYDII